MVLVTTHAAAQEESAVIVRGVRHLVPLVAPEQTDGPALPHDVALPGMGHGRIPSTLRCQPGDCQRSIAHSSIRSPCSFQCEATFFEGWTRGGSPGILGVPTR